MKRISVGVCCYNEEKNIALMYEAISREMQKLANYDYEIIFEDNASTDDSQNILRNLALKDKHVKVILNQTNFGPARSGTNCMSRMMGDAYISLPCDFQEPPELIPQFVEEWEKGHDIVWGQKIKSKENVLKRFCRNIYYNIIDAMSDYKQIPHITGFGIMDKKVVDIILPTKMQDPEISIRHIISEYGFNIKLIPYTQQKRLYGKSSYNASKYYSFAITSLCNTSIKPLRMMTILGFLVSVISVIIGIIYFVFKLLYWDTLSVGIAPLVIGMFFLGAVQLLCIGILGEYIAILLRKTINKPVVVEKETINFD